MLMTFGMRFLSLGILGLFTALASVDAATPLYTFDGTSAPTTQGWATSASATHVIGSSYNDGGTNVWRIYDPGTAAGGGTLANLNYSATLNAALKDSVMTSGWELSASVKVPDSDPTSGEAWVLGSNTWVGFIANNAAAGNRQLWALQWGRDASGNTIVSAYGASGSLTLTPGYHDYSIVYDPLTSLATIRIDGEVWKTYSGGPIAGTGSNQVYWGDNNSQPALQPERSAYYASVQFSQTTAVPEPSRALLVLLACGFITLARRRRTTDV